MLDMEYKAVQRAPRGNDRKKKVSEGRSVITLDGTVDHYNVENVKNRPEIVELSDLSLQIQSLLYGEISKLMIPFDKIKAIPLSLQDTEVTLMVDISSSMTKLSNAKRLSAMILSYGISSILQCFNIPVHFYAFGDRESIWRLSDNNEPKIQIDLVHLIDALRQGGRPGSYPLDAAITSHQEWNQSGRHFSNHITIIISDFISAQVVDRELNWSTEYQLGKCILISLNSEFNKERLDEKKIPRENGLRELQRVDKGRCPYSQLWLFSSEGYGDLPEEALDKDINKVAPFLEATAEFWKNGGGLFLFCDNHPYNFEANYLLQKHFNFTHEGRNGVSVVHLGGNYLGKNQIKVAPSENMTHSSFSPKVHLEAPGPSKKRISLRPGLIKFSEGNTISFAVDEKVRPLTTSEQLWPFTPFAWTSENVDPPRPFILFFDPKIPKESEASYCTKTCQGSTPSPGPIVLHGGFTSAFSEFGQDEKGTGRLVISIACWLTRYEERFYAHRTNGSEILTTTPALTKQYSTKTFTGWRPKPAVIRPRHSILILDGSGSMNGEPYQKLIEAANGYIDIQTQNNGIISIISFSNTAQIIYEKQKRRLANSEGYYGDMTYFNLALQTAVQVAQRNTPEYECRVLFFTDGGNNGDDFTGSANQLHQMKVRIDAVGKVELPLKKQWMMLYKPSVGLLQLIINEELRLYSDILIKYSMRWAQFNSYIATWTVAPGSSTGLWGRPQKINTES
ncbi:MAG: hypothetical protein EZS28_035340, partial [Streblomastix strix]